MSCDNAIYADVAVATSQAVGRFADSAPAVGVMGGGICTIWDSGATRWDQYEVAGVTYSTTWDCGPAPRPAYASESVAAFPFNRVIEGGQCTLWDGDSTQWDAQTIAGVDYFTRWDCAGNPQSDDLEDVCRP